MDKVHQRHIEKTGALLPTKLQGHSLCPLSLVFPVPLVATHFLKMPCMDSVHHHGESDF
jgi:hypothetical protein